MKTEVTYHTITSNKTNVLFYIFFGKLYNTQNFFLKE